VFVGALTILRHAGSAPATFPLRRIENSCVKGPSGFVTVAFSAQGNSAAIVEVTDSTFGCLGDSSTTEEGWCMLFEGGFKTWIERKR
jgi:hypothetical protein